MSRRSRWRMLVGVSGLLTIAGLLFNDWLPTGIVGDLSSPHLAPRRAVLQAGSALAIAAGLAGFALAGPIARKLPQILALFVATTFALGLFISGDIALGHFKLLDTMSISQVGIFRSDPLLGWRLRPGVSNIGADGFRLVDNRGQARRSLHLYGDSFTFGVGVGSEEAFPSVMAREHLADDVHVHNGGVAAYGIEQIYGRFRSTEDRIGQGDLVLFTPISNDLRRNLDDFAFVSRLVYHQSKPGQISHFPRYHDGELEATALDSRGQRLRSWLFVGSITDKPFEFLHRALHAPDTDGSARAMFADARRRVEARGARFALIFLPRPKELRKSRWDHDVSTFDNLDIWHAFPQGEIAREIELSDGHYNPKGHEFAARAIIGRLVNERLLQAEDEEGR